MPMFENSRVAQSEVHPLYGLSFGTFPANFREFLFHALG
jgi:hypothetical protein